MRAGRTVLAGLLSLLVFFGILEAGARLAGLRPERPAVPMFSWRRRGELYTLVPERWTRPRDGVRVRVNALGLRGPEIGRKDDRPRIVVLGDSVAFGFGLPEEQALPAQVARSLAGRGHAVEVVGAAVPGWCARQHRLFLARHAGDLVPDLVLATVVLNDVRELKVGEDELAASLGMANALAWLTERSALVAGVRTLVGSSGDPFASRAWVEALAYESASPAVKSAMDAEMEELRRLRAEGRDVGVPLALVVLPFRFQLEEPASDAPQRALAEFAAREGIPLLDVLPALRAHPASELFLDHVHLTARGSELVAREVAAWLADRAPPDVKRAALEAPAPDR